MQCEPKAMILGTGMAVPDRVLTNSDLEKMVDTTDRWITERTGIKERRIAEPGSALSDLAAAAALKALADAGIGAGDLDMIMVATVSGDVKFPSTACLVQQKISAVNAAAFDLSAACSGVMYGLKLAESLIQTGACSNILLIGAEMLSSMVNWQDRDTCVLFGDGAGALLLGPSLGNRGIFGVDVRSDGTYTDILINPGGGSQHPPGSEQAADAYSIQMRGREVFRHAVTRMTESLRQTLALAAVSTADLDLVIPHQANMRIIEAVEKNFQLPPEKVFKNVERYGNTSAASIPIALDEARRTGVVEAGDLVGLVTFGAGLTWGSALLRL